MEEELNSRTLPKKQNGERATKSIMRPSRKIAEEKTRAKMLEASQNNGMYFFKKSHLLKEILLNNIKTGFYNTNLCYFFIFR